MKIGKIILSIGSDIIRDKFPDSSYGHICNSYYKKYSLQGPEVIKCRDGTFRYCRGLDGKWFLDKSECAWWYRTNLYELSLGDNEKFDTLGEAKEHYKNL